MSAPGKGPSEKRARKPAFGFLMPLAATAASMMVSAPPTNGSRTRPTRGSSKTQRDSHLYGLMTWIRLAMRASPWSDGMARGRDSGYKSQAMTRQDMLAQSVELSRVLLARYFKGFDDSNHTKQPPGLPNHFAWTLGHLALNLHRVAQQFEGPSAGALPEADFVTGDGRSGDARRYDTEGVAFGSRPTADTALYP